MLNNKWIKVVSVIFALVIMIGWALNYKTKSEIVHSNIYELYLQIDEVKELHHHLNDDILKSTLYRVYNNDYLVQDVFALVHQLESIKQSVIYTTNNYPKSQLLLEKLIEYQKQCDEKIELLKRSNGKIKNSFLFIISSLEHMSRLKKEDNQKLLNIITKLISLKGSMGEENLNYKDIDLSFLDVYKAEDAKEELYKNLFKVHINLLKNNLPDYIQLVNEIIKDEIFENSLEQIKESLKDENSKIVAHLDIEYYALILFSILTLILIIYYIFLTEKEKQKITKLQTEYKKSVTTDLLTGLQNRNAYMEVMNTQASATVILFDISDFSAINNLYGITIGDFVLKSVGEKINEIGTKLNGRIFKVGADQFVVIVDKCTDNDALVIANHIITSIEKRPCQFDGLDQAISVQMKAGISSESPYLINAALAMKSIENDYSKKIKIYENSLDKTQEIQKNLTMIQKIKYSLVTDNIAMLFQPIIDLNTKQVIKHEALVRLKDNDEYISPYLFLELSKKAKLYTKITHEVITKSIMAVKEKNVDVSVNLSIEDILHQETYDFIMRMLKENSSIANKLTFELLESEEIMDFNALKSFIKSAKEFGVSIAIDDFGSGYSNYNYLLELDVDILKIDGSLIKNIDKSENNQLVVRSIVEFAKLAKIKTVAEFVSSKEIEEVVCKLGIDYGQGFYYSAPKLL